MSPEWPPDDPLFDPDDSAAVEREERRREREAKRQQREAKRGKKAAPAAPSPKPAAPPAPRTPEQEFWDEDPEPAPPVPGQEPAGPAVGGAAEPEPGIVERGRRRLLGRRRSKDAAPGRPKASPPTAPKPAAGEPKTEIHPQAPSKPTTSEPPAPRGPASSAVATPSDPARPPADSGKSQIDPAGPSAHSDKPQVDPARSQADPDKSQVDPARSSGDAASPVPALVPPQDAATPSQGDSLGKDALGGAAGAAVAGLAGGAAAAGSADAAPTASGNQPPTGEHQPVTDQPPTGEHAPPTGAGTHEYAPPPAPPEGPTAGDFQPLVRDWDFHDEGDPEMTGAARVGRRRGEDGGRRRGGPAGALLRHPFRILAVIVAILVLWFLNSLFQPFHGDPQGRVEVKIPKGSGVGEVGDILEKRGVIDGSYLGLVDASTLFQMRVTLDGKRGDLYAGHFQLQKGMSYGDAVSALSKEPSASSKPGITTVTIPEGYSRPLAAKLISEDGVPGNYVKATRRSKYLNPAEYGGKGAKSLEGFLFPDTFELKPKAPVGDLVQRQLQDFKRRIKKVNMKYAKSKNLTVFDVVTIASMIEGEAGVAKQRKLVSSVIYNRLHDDMTLGLDTTIRFATGNYSKPLTQKELETSSPYNTRNHLGLPPGPISSPGLAALQAAAHPAKTGYLFYVNNPNSCNELTFSKTEEEFEDNVEKYEAAREKAGGNAPSTCGE
jgi:UPF0755 protein